MNTCQNLISLSYRTLAEEWICLAVELTIRFRKKSHLESMDANKYDSIRRFFSFLSNDLLFIGSILMNDIYYPIDVCF